MRMFLNFLCMEAINEANVYLVTEQSSRAAEHLISSVHRSETGIVDIVTVPSV